MTSVARLHHRGQRPGYEAPSLPTCGDCRFVEFHPGVDDRCAISGERIRSQTPACERYVTVRRGP